MGIHFAPHNHQGTKPIKPHHFVLLSFIQKKKKERRVLVRPWHLSELLSLVILNKNGDSKIHLANHFPHSHKRFHLPKMLEALRLIIARGITTVYEWDSQLLHHFRLLHVIRLSSR